MNARSHLYILIAGRLLQKVVFGAMPLSCYAAISLPGRRLAAINAEAAVKTV